MKYGYGGISLLSLLTFPGFFIVAFLKPMNDPSQTLGTDMKQYMSKTTTNVYNEIVAEEFSSQFARFIIRPKANRKLGNSIEVSILQRSQLEP